MIEFIGERLVTVFGQQGNFLSHLDNGVEVLIAKTAFAGTDSWYQLWYDKKVRGNTVLEIDSGYYTIGLLRGGNSHHVVTPYINTHLTSGGGYVSEWDRYMNWFDVGWSLSVCEEEMDSGWILYRGGHVVYEHGGVGRYFKNESHRWRPILRKLVLE